MPKFILKISRPGAEALLEDPNLECFVFSSALPEDYLQRQTARAVQAGKIVLLEGENAAALCLRLNADGIIADLSASAAVKKDMAALRRQIGSRFLGVICRNRRHEAMIVSENEPDFIIFKIWRDGAEKTRELAEWYHEFFLLQMAVEPEDEDADVLSYPCDMAILSPDTYKILVAKK